MEDLKVYSSSNPLGSCLENTELPDAPCTLFIHAVDTRLDLTVATDEQIKVYHHPYVPRK